MTPPRPTFYQCPHCSRLLKLFSQSGNSCGATFWTDGMATGPMIPGGSPFYRCPHNGCGKFFWPEDANVVFYLSYGGDCVYEPGSQTPVEDVEGFLRKHIASFVVEKRWRPWYDIFGRDTDLLEKLEMELGRIPRSVCDGLDDCHKAIGLGFPDTPLRWKRLRLFTWRETLEELRCLKEVAFPVGTSISHSDRSKSNMKALVELLDRQDETERLMLVELHRQLGEFDKAELLMEFPWVEQIQRSADFIRSLLKAKDMLLRPITTEG